MTIMEKLGKTVIENGNVEFFEKVYEFATGERKNRVVSSIEGDMETTLEYKVDEGSDYDSSLDEIVIALTATDDTGEKVTFMEFRSVRLFIEAAFEVDDNEVQEESTEESEE